MKTRAVLYNNFYFTNDFAKYFDPTKWLITKDVDQFLAADCTYKLAMLGKTYILRSANYDWDLAPVIDQILNVSDRIILFESELHTHYAETIFKYQHPKITWVIPGIIYDRDDTIFNNQWLRAEIETYSNPGPAEDLTLINPHDVKPYYFDCLIGAGKQHKDFLARQIREDKLEDKIILRHGYARFIYPDGAPKRGAVFDSTVYKGWPGSLIPIMPLNVYNESAYSILGETSYDNRYAYINEKPAKCFMGHRLFIMFGGQHWLRTIQSLGFKTFDGIVDESYDLEEDHQTRWNMAYAEVKRLLAQDQRKILDAVKPIVEHNYRLMWETPWRQQLDEQVLSKIDFN